MPRPPRVADALVVTMLCLGGLTGAARLAGAQAVSEAVRERLRNRLETVPAADLAVRDEPVYASAALPEFYVSRLYQPAWSDHRGPLPVADSLIAAVRDAGGEGLRPADYHLRTIERTLREIRGAAGPPGARRVADLDLLLTDAFLVYGSHLLIGRVNPETIDPEWRANRRGADLAMILGGALASGHVREALATLLPPQPGYARLRAALGRYRDVAARGGWPTIPDGDRLERGIQSPRVRDVRTRLALTGDLVEADTDGADLDLFDEAVAHAVMAFQRRHGLAEDGMVGPETLAAMNVPVAERLHQLEINLERWRWLPQDLGRRHVLVNIAAFEMEVVEADTAVLRMRVMVGRPYRRTPVFSGNMTYLVLAPFWHVPRNLAVEDKLPLIKRNPAYLTEQHIRVFEGWGIDAREVDPASVTWSTITAKTFPYRLRQDPGPNNALGRVKFMFPNARNVYLHDTPARELFDKPDRAFSSGCIRLERPLELAEYVLRGDTRWSRKALEATIARWQEQTVALPRPIPVHLLYWTAWAAPDGRVHFRKDLYGRDTRLERALQAAPPSDE